MSEKEWQCWIVHILIVQAHHDKLIEHDIENLHVRVIHGNVYVVANNQYFDFIQVNKHDYLYQEFNGLFIENTGGKWQISAHDRVFKVDFVLIEYGVDSLVSDYIKKNRGYAIKRG